MCARARECKAKRSRIQRQAERVRVFDIPHQLHKPPGTSVSVGESARARAHGLAVPGTLGGPGPQGLGACLGARDYRDVTLSLWPPWTGTPREQHSPTPRLTLPSYRAPLGTRILSLPIHGPFCPPDHSGR